VGLQPAQLDVCTALNQLCAHTIVDVKIKLEVQMKMDEGAAKKLEDEKKAQEQARLIAEREAKEKEEKIREMEIAIAEM
jgi:hypothetical protein